MVFKSVGYSSVREYRESPRRAEPIHVHTAIPDRQVGGMVVHLKDRKGRSYVERITSFNDDVLGYNLLGNKVLVRAYKNDRAFDQYVALPFTKGVTERVTGRTLLVLGSNAHHIEAMQNQFDGVLWKKDDLKEQKMFGNCIRWINVGGERAGFIGLDYNPNAKASEGVATCYQDIQFLAKILLELKYDSKKRLFILKPPYIQEREEGINMRAAGLETLADFSSKKYP